jgi:hypothetical protein
MENIQVKKIESQARKLMAKDGQIWSKFNWQSGGQVDMEKYKKELKVKPRSISYLFYHIFEDANYHTLNEALQEMGAFIGSYANSESEYQDYKKSGGRTYNL